MLCTQPAYRQYAGPLAVLLALLVLVLAGCAESAPEPSPLDAAPSAPDASASSDLPGNGSASGAATNAPTQSPTDEGSATGPPVMPPAARGTTRAAAGPFVRYWIDTFNYSTTSLKTDTLRHLSFPLCQACSEIATSIERIRNRGGHFEGTGWRLRRIEVLSPGRPRRPQVRAFIVYTPQVVVPHAGAKARRFEGGRTVLYTFNLAVDEGTWRVAGIVGMPQ